MTEIASGAQNLTASPQSHKYCVFIRERRTQRGRNTGARKRGMMSNWGTIKLIDKKEKPRVSDIFTRKPYSADSDLGKIMKRKRKKEREHERYLAKKAKFQEEHSEEEWQVYEREKLKSWREKNRDKLHEQQKRYRAKHAEELREKRQAYYQANKERIKAKSKARYTKMKEVEAYES